MAKDNKDSSNNATDLNKSTTKSDEKTNIPVTENVTPVVETVVATAKDDQKEDTSEKDMLAIHAEMFSIEKQYQAVNRSIEPVAIFLKNGEVLTVPSKGTSLPLKKSNILRISKPSAIGFREV